MSKLRLYSSNGFKLNIDLNRNGFTNKVVDEWNITDRNWLMSTFVDERSTRIWMRMTN